MTADLSDHPFSPENIAYESGAPSRQPRALQGSAVMADDRKPQMFTVRLTKEERDAVIDALSRVLAGEYDGDIPIKFFESALEKI